MFEEAESFDKSNVLWYDWNNKIKIFDHNYNIFRLSLKKSLLKDEF